MTENSRTYNSIRNSLWGIIAKILNMICPFIFRAIIIRKLGSEYIGLNGLFVSILSVLNMTELGFGSAITFMMYKPIAENDLLEIRRLLNAIRNIYKIVGITIIIAGCSVFPFLNVLVKNDTGADVNLYLLYSMYLFNTAVSYLASSYRSTLFTAHQRNDIIYKITIIVEIIKYSLQAIVLLLTNNYYLYLLVFALSVIPQNLLYYYFTKKIYPDIYCKGNISSEQKATIKSKVIPLLGHRIGGTVIVSIDHIIISAFLGISVLTKYDNYFTIFHSVVTLLTVLRNSVIASLGNKLYTSSIDDLYSTYKKVFFIWVQIVGWCTCFLVGLYQPFINIWVGNEYLYNDNIMLWICAYFFFWQFRFIGVTMKEAAGLWEPDRWKPIIGMVINFGMSLLIVKATGSVLGVLIPTILVMFLLYFPWETYVLFTDIFHRNSKEYLFLTLKCILSVFVSVFFVYLITSRFQLFGIGFFILRIIICIFVPAIIFTVFHFKSEQYQSILAVIKKIIYNFSPYLDRFK